MFYKIALLKYFKHKEGSSAVASNNLPDEIGPFCSELPSSSILEANLEVIPVTGKHEGSVSCAQRYLESRKRYSKLCS